ncbi:hypothetical protein V8C35DRAFT_314880 [Trichoderma chlorosporum]
MSSSTPPPEAQRESAHLNTTVPIPAPYFAMPTSEQTAYQPQFYANPAPFVPYPAPAMQFEPPRPKQNRIWERAKIALHASSATLAVAGIGLAFSSLHFQYFAYTVVIATAPPSLIALPWGIAEVVARVFRKDHRGIHPGAHIALCLVIFLIGTTLTSLFGPWAQSSWGVDYNSSTCTSAWDAALNQDVVTCSDGDDDGGASRRAFVHEQSVSIAAAAVTYIIAAINFALFVGACVDTSRDNIVGARPIYVLAQPPMMQGWQPIPQATSVQQPAARDASPAEGEMVQSEAMNKGKEPAVSDAAERDGVGNLHA